MEAIAALIIFAVLLYCVAAIAVGVPVIIWALGYYLSLNALLCITLATILIFAYLWATFNTRYQKNWGMSQYNYKRQFRNEMKASAVIAGVVLCAVWVVAFFSVCEGTADFFNAVSGWLFR